MSAGKWLWQGKIVGLDQWGASGADYKKEVIGLKAVGKYKLIIKLKKPFPQFVYTLAMGYSAIVAKEAVQKYGRQFAVHPVGSGPWKLDQFDSEKIELIKNPNYPPEIFDLKEHGYDEKIHAYTE